MTKPRRSGSVSILARRADRGACRGSVIGSKPSEGAFPPLPFGHARMKLRADILAPPIRAVLNPSSISSSSASKECRDCARSVCIPACHPARCSATFSPRTVFGGASRPCNPGCGFAAEFEGRDDPALAYGNAAHKARFSVHLLSLRAAELRSAEAKEPFERGVRPDCIHGGRKMADGRGTHRKSMGPQLKRAGS